MIIVALTKDRALHKLMNYLIPLKNATKIVFNVTDLLRQTVFHVKTHCTYITNLV